MKPTRDDVIAYARLLDGFSASPHDPVARAAYLELVAPVEPMALAEEMARMSGCALVVRGVWRRFIDHELLSRHYRIGHAVSDLVEIARRAGALRSPDTRPEPGDVVIVGGGADGGGPEHVWIALDSPDYAFTLPGLDGGQVDAGGYQCVRLREHVLSDGYDWAQDDGAGGRRRRRVRHVIDLAAVLDAFGREAGES